MLFKPVLWTKHVKNYWHQQLPHHKISRTVFWSLMINSSTSKQSSSFSNTDLELMLKLFATSASTASKQSIKWKRTSSKTSVNANTILLWWIATCRLWTDMKLLKRSESSCTQKIFISQSSLLSLDKQANKTSWNASRVAWIKLLVSHWSQMSSKSY